jgi:uncharacterized protein DUF3579
VLHSLTRRGVFASSEKAHGGKKPPCGLLKMLGFSAAIFIRFGMGMQAFSPSFGPLRPLLHTHISCRTLQIAAAACDSLEPLQLKIVGTRIQLFCNENENCVFPSPTTRPCVAQRVRCCIAINWQTARNDRGFASFPAQTWKWSLTALPALVNFSVSGCAERLCGCTSLFGEDQRIRYSSYLELVISAGIKCVVIDLRLEETSPEAFRFLLSFACDNELQVRDGRY